jgi:hypothetical protein
MATAERHRWQFAARFRRNAFGWASELCHPAPKDVLSREIRGRNPDRHLSLFCRAVWDVVVPRTILRFGRPCALSPRHKSSRTHFARAQCRPPRPVPAAVSFLDVQRRFRRSVSNDCPLAGIAARWSAINLTVLTAGGIFFG